MNRYLACAFNTFILACFLILLSPSLPAQDTTGTMQNLKIIRIVNGDTCIARRSSASTQYTQDQISLHLAGIKAPPANQPAGKPAFDFLKNKLLNKTVDASFDQSMNGWRIILPGLGDLSAAMVRRGLVFRENDGDRYLQAEQDAQKNKAGRWQSSPIDSSPKQPKKIPVYDYGSHTVPEYFHDISEDIQINYVQKRPAYSPGHTYNLIISGNDLFYERATVPRTIYIYTSPQKDPRSVKFVISGMDIREIDKLRPGDTLTVQCTFVQNVELSNLYGTDNVPLFDFIGKAPTLGVGGELMYRK